MSYEKNYYKSPCKKVYYKKMHYKKNRVIQKITDQIQHYVSISTFQALYAQQQSTIS